MVGVCRREINKPSTSFKLKGCNRTYYYLSDYNERKKLNQYIKRCGEILNNTDKQVVKKRDLVQSAHLSEIQFGKRGAIMFSEEIINYYNADVRSHTDQESSVEEEETHDVIHPPDKNRNPLKDIERYIAGSFDVEELYRIEDWCRKRIERMRQITDCTDEKMIIYPSSMQHQHQQQQQQPNKNATLVKQKKRIQPTLVSRFTKL